MMWEHVRSNTQIETVLTNGLSKSKHLLLQVNLDVFRPCSLPDLIQIDAKFTWVQDMNYPSAVYYLNNLRFNMVPSVILLFQPHTSISA